MSELLKTARLSTQAEKERARRWRAQNKVKSERYRKKYKRQLASGARLKKKRLGTASGGFSFVMSGPSGGGGGSSLLKSSPASVSHNTGSLGGSHALPTPGHFSSSLGSR